MAWIFQLQPFFSFGSNPIANYILDSSCFCLIREFARIRRIPVFYQTKKCNTAMLTACSTQKKKKTCNQITKQTKRCILTWLSQTRLRLTPEGSPWRASAVCRGASSSGSYVEESAEWVLKIESSSFVISFSFIDKKLKISSQTSSNYNVKETNYVGWA